jgi:hypothetical protein
MLSDHRASGERGACVQVLSISGSHAEEKYDQASFSRTYPVSGAGLVM